MLSFVPLAKTHIPLLFSWLQHSHVQEFWDRGTTWTQDLVEEKYSRYVDGCKSLRAFLIHYAGAPVGYVQVYNAYDFPREGYDLSAALGYAQLEEGGSLAALDLLIGEPEMTGKGIGTLALQAFLQEKVWPHFNACVTDPDPANTRAIRAYEKAGFRTIRKANPLIMVCHKTSSHPTFIRTGVYGVARQEGRLLLILQTRGMHQDKWDLPGGGIEPGESIEETLRREFIEEVGRTFVSMTHLANRTATTLHPRDAWQLHQVGLLYRVEGLSLEEQHRPEQEYRWILPGEIPGNCLTPFAQFALEGK